MARKQVTLCSPQQSSSCKAVLFRILSRFELNWAAYITKNRPCPARLAVYSYRQGQLQLSCMYGYLRVCSERVEVVLCPVSMLWWPCPNLCVLVWGTAHEASDAS